MATIFVSTARRDEGGIPEALGDLKTPEHSDLRNRTPGGTDAIGRWTDGAEGSRVFEGSPEHAVALGRHFKQKSVLIFTHHPHGADRLYTITHPAGHHTLHDLDTALQSNGILNHTTSPDGRTTYVVTSPGDEVPVHPEKIAEIAHTLGSHVNSRGGKRDFLDTGGH